MSTPSRSQADEARRFLEDISEINERFGMRTVSSEDTYNAAVSGAAAAFTWTATVNRGAQLSR